MTDVPRGIPSPDDRASRLAWFAECAPHDKQPPELPLRCPCCGCLTLGERGGFEVCPVCVWEDDGQDDHDADTVRGGPNGGLSLTQARANYRRLGACCERSVGRARPPKPAEQPEHRQPDRDAAADGGER